jgi:hypothetical protein
LSKSKKGKGSAKNFFGRVMCLISLNYFFSTVQNQFEYLVALQKHASQLAEHPQNWMPWNYKQAVPAEE